jgi:hypothetical protein
VSNIKLKTTKDMRPPPDVKCSRKGCRGSAHEPHCPIFLWALENWDIPKTEPKKRERVRGHHPEAGEARMTDEQRAALAREGGKKGGRPPSPIPYTLLETLKKGKFRVKAEYKNGDEIGEAAAGMAGFALERLAYAAAGRIPPRRVPSAVKAAQFLREEICEPVEKAVLHRGGLDLGSALDKITAATAPAAPPAPPTPAEEKPE